MNRNVVTVLISNTSVMTRIRYLGMDVTVNARYKVNIYAREVVYKNQGAFLS